MLTFLRSLDAKLVSTILTTAAARIVLELGGDPIGDPLWNGVVSLTVGAVVGWLWPNTGTVLRSEQESGNPDVPAGLRDELGQITWQGVLVGAIVAVLVLVAIAVL